MLKYGYGGRILRVDLTKLSCKIEPLKTSWIKPVIGGRAANAKRLYEELDAGCDLLSPDNMLVFGAGPLTGSFLPGSAFYTVSAKSPQTGQYGYSQIGGYFAAEMKQTGFDQIIITGKACKLMYLVITETGVEFVECPGFSGKSIIDTTTAIRKKLKDYAVEVAAIGSAGENQVHSASVVSSGCRTGGRSGMGSVMRSKNLKAVAVWGSLSVETADPIGLKNIANDIDDRILNHDEYQMRYQFGPANPGSKNNFKAKNKSCFNCNLHCIKYTFGGDTESEDSEIDPLGSLFSAIGNDTEKIVLLADCLTMCRITAFEMGILNLKNGAAILNAGTGLNYTAKYLEKMLNKIIDLEHEMNRNV